MNNDNYYSNLVKNAEKIVLKIKKLEKNFSKNKDKIALLNTSLFLLIKEMKSFVKE